MSQAHEHNDRVEIRDHVLLSLESKARGFKNTLAFRRFCRREGIPIHVTGRKEWVRPSDVDAVITRSTATHVPNSANVAHAVASLMNPKAK
jgi:hypothetical protein